jgi:hypothetical protein
MTGAKSRTVWSKEIVRPNNDRRENSFSDPNDTLIHFIPTPTRSFGVVESSFPSVHFDVVILMNCRPFRIIPSTRR